MFINKWLKRSSTEQEHFNLLFMNVYDYQNFDEE